MRLLSAAVVLLMCAATHAQRGIIVDYAEPPPRTEVELFSKAVAVVRGIVEGRRLDVPPRNEGPTSSTYTLRIVELLKSDGQLAFGQVVDVHRHGGFDGNSTDLAFAVFEVGDELVLFLERGRNGWYWPRNGPDGAFKLTNDGHVHAYGRFGDVSKRHAGSPTLDFLAILRKHAK
jgi:hypothetical protein